jgi:hypothetical protein
MGTHVSHYSIENNILFIIINLFISQKRLIPYTTTWWQVHLKESNFEYLEFQDYSYIHTICEIKYLQKSVKFYQVNLVFLPTSKKTYVK